MKGIFSIQLKPQNIQLNCFTYENEGDYKTTKYITFESEPEYKSIGAYDISFEENEIEIESPKNISVILRDNYNKENVKQFRYFSGSPNEEGIISSSEIEIVIDYDTDEFSQVWEIFSQFKKKKIEIVANISAPQVNTPGLTDIVKVNDGESWSVRSFLIKVIV